MYVCSYMQAELADMLQYNVPAGEEEENAIAARALHGDKSHKDFANCENVYQISDRREANESCSETDYTEPLLTARRACQA